MGTSNNWSKKEPEEDSVYRIYENGEKRVMVRRFEDGTWDTYMDDKLVSNSDTREEADDRARELIDADS